ncbi:hypothetical protein BC936DRAFT_149809 [Jimgerdemannia flammicorona]|uniref:RING-type E3 ubiquitin transferase n=1 Tax=Jimgerdemannia flammicorona TaxID=994334 RepID=A0A433D038_9FUNG|nr:hypothetical protein BC936DRAFT_149809 [Jimgerdemannia flammicorona]
MYLKIIPFNFENGKQELVQVQKNDKVLLLRQLISNRYGQPVERLRLISMGKVLEDLTADGTDALLYNAYGVKENQVINVSLKPLLCDPTSEPVPAAAITTTAATTTAVTTVAVPETTAVPPLEVGAPASSSVVPEPAFAIPPELKEEEWICPRCKNNPLVKKCKECGCQGCELKDGNPMICDQCEMYWHFECAGLDKEPEEEHWFCPDCVNKDVSKVIAEGQGIKSSSKKAKMPSATQTKNWGGGMACAGKQKSCVIVDKDHIGPIPGVHVGQSWLYRLQCSEWGVHRPPVGGIGGGEKTGCQSIVLAAGYPEDKDGGEEFTYTGSGGRDLKTGNKRTGSQTSDQAMDRFNLALAMTCAAKLDKINGADAGDDWQKSRPIRVVRGEKLGMHHPEFAPAKGQRYDGLYKVVKYWKEKGKSDFLVWRFAMRRDDPDPAPWTEEGKQRIKDLGLRMVYPEKTTDGEDTENRNKENIQGKGKGKGKAPETLLETAKIKKYMVPADVVQMIQADARDARIWDDVLAQEFWSEYEFLHYVFATAFACCVCAERITNPVTTTCSHVACQKCLQKATKEEARCPWCRHDLKDPTTGKVSYATNKELIAILKHINWAYAGGSLPERYRVSAKGTKAEKVEVQVKETKAEKVEVQVKGTKAEKVEVQVKGTKAEKMVQIKGTKAEKKVQIKGTKAEKMVQIKGTKAEKMVQIKGTKAEKMVQIKGTKTEKMVQIKGTKVEKMVQIKGKAVIKMTPAVKRKAVEKEMVQRTLDELDFVQVPKKVKVASAESAVANGTARLAKRAKFEVVVEI